MHLTSADARAAREGFHFVVMRGGTRVAYTTTAAEAKRECGKGCKVYPLARMRYTSQNPKAKGLSARDRFEAKRAQESEKWLREFSRDPVQVEAGSIRKRITERAGLGAHKAGCNWTGCVKGCPNANRWLEVHRQRELVELDRLKGKISAAKTATERKFWNAVLKEVSLARNPATKRAMLASLNRRIAAAERAGMPVDYLLEQRDLLVRSLKAKGGKKANPGLTKAGKRHLIQTMHKAGADTFTKKMRYVRKHMPHITDPAAFVGYVMQGEKR